MPFAVVETTNARGCKELSVVPDKWLRSSRNGNIVLWPNAKTVSEQEKLIRDEGSCPKKSWLKYKCMVKRNPVSSFAEAKRLLEELSGESSSDVSELQRRKRKATSRDTNVFQKMLILENTSLHPSLPAPQASTSNVQLPAAANDSLVSHSPLPIVIEVRGNAGDAFHPESTSLPASSQAPVFAPVIENNAETSQYEILPQGPAQSSHCGYEEVAEDNIATVQYVTYESEHQAGETNNAVYKLLTEILEQQQQINRRLDLLERRVADIATQNEFILDAIRKLSSCAANNPEEPLSFRFDPMEQDQQLADLEEKLADNEFRSNMVKWLRLNVSGDCADNRMLCVLDMLFSKDFQTKCTWTGASRKGPKLAIMPNRNILQVFQQIGSDETEVVTQRKLADFFKKKLKNSLKRSIAIGIRRGTRHVRRRKQTKALEQDVKSEPVGGSCNALGDQIDEAAMSCESFDEPESEDAGSAVNSSDALDHADIPTDSSDVNDSSE
ncbi:hypothetical protein RP20_CCG013967 [Aedes albopictus]|nr:hypothetical protein RP20_CCG013967 [Aedes albopictus]